MPKVQVALPSAVREAAGGRRMVELEASTIDAALHAVSAAHPALHGRIFRVDGLLRESVAVFLNGTEVRGADLARGRLQEGDVVTIVPAAAGGSGAKGPPNAAPAHDSAPLSHDEIRRYSRHLLLPEVGMEGQKRLRGARVLIVGAGGLGSPASLYLAAAGVGTLGLVEFDSVDVSNLQRQILYRTSDVGQPKAERAAEALRALNPGTEILRHAGPIEASNALEIIRGYDVVIDGSDNFPTRYLVNDACVLLGKPDVYGSVYRFEGQATVFDSSRGPCYRCLFPEPPPPGFVPNCAEGGVLGVLPGLIGEIQATEALKLLLGVGEPLIGRLLMYDALEMRFRELTIRADPECVISGTHPSQAGLIDYPAFCGVDEGAVAARDLPTIQPEELAEQLKQPEPPLLVDVRQPGEWAIAHLPAAKLIPRSELGERIGELTGASSIVVYCSAGSRSAAATRLLLDLGLVRVRHLAGGLRAWAERVDPSMPIY